MTDNALIGYVTDRANRLDAIAELIDHGGLKDPAAAEDEYAEIRDELLTIADENSDNEDVLAILREVVPA